MKKFITQHNLKFFSRIIFLFVLLFVMSNTYGDELATAEGTGSTTTTSTDVYVDVASATVNVGTNVTEVMVVATFEVLALDKTAHKAYFKLIDNTNTTESQVIIRHLERATNGDKGIGSLVYIFTVPENSGATEFILQHATSNGSYNNTTSGTIAVIALGTTTSHIPLGNDVKSITTADPVAAGETWEVITGLTTGAVSLPADGDIFLATSINSELATGTNQTGEWKLQQKKGAGAWEDIGLSITRSLNSPDDQGIASLGMTITGLTKDDYYFQLLHKGSDVTVQTLNTSIIAVALAYLDNNNIGRAFPAFSTSSASETTTFATLTPALSQVGTPASNTDMFIYAQYKMSAPTAFDSPTFDIYVVDDNHPLFNYSSQDQQRRLNSDTDSGSGASVGLVQSLKVDSTYTASLRHASNGTILLTTSSIILSGFQTTDYTCAGYWVGGTIDHLNEWNNNSNWACGNIPTSSTNVALYVKTHNPIISTSANCNSLAIESDASLSIGETYDLTVAGDLNNSGTLTVKSSAAGTGSIIVGGTATGSVIMERYMNNADWSDWQDGWHFLSSPVAAQTISTAFATGTYDFYCWWELTNQWVNYKNTTTAPTWSTANTISNGLSENTTDFLVGKGYMAAYDEEGTKSFTGTLNVDNVAISGLNITDGGTNSSWHLLGNPYSSGLTWDDTWSTTTIGGTIQIWNETGSSYSTITAATTGVIPATNGFMVQSTADGASLTIPESKQTHGGTFYKTAEFPIIKLKANNIDNLSFQESKLLFIPESTTGYESEYDCNYLAGYAPLFYSKIDNMPMAVNSMPDVEESTTISFTFIKNEGTNFSIEMYEMENMEMDVWLMDKKLNKDHNLTENPVYVFTAFEQDDSDRFVIHFSPLGIEEPESAEHIQIWAASNSINILNPNNSIGEVRLINMYGQEVQRSKLNGDSNQRINVNVATGYYIVNTVTNNEVVNTKIYLR